MKFMESFEKVAGTFDGALRVAKRIGVGAAQVGKGAAKGLAQAGQTAIQDFKGLGAAAKGLNTGAGRKAFGSALGKAAPSIALGGAAALGAKKIYDKTIGQDQGQQYYQ